MLTKTDIAKVMTIWEMKPHIACNSREKCFASFMSSLKRNQTVIDATYWHKIVALSILYKDMKNALKRDVVKMVLSQELQPTLWLRFPI